MQLDGLLSRFPLRELLELSVASLVNGVIEVQAPSGVYHLFFVEGNLVHAISPEASGFDALWPLFELSEAPFRFVAGATTQERTFAEPTLHVIDQAMQVAQRWSAVRPLIPRLDIVPELVSPVKGDHVRIFEEDWPILSSVDGTRTIADVARKALLDPLEVCIGLLRLKERGLVQLRKPGVPAQKQQLRPVATDPQAEVVAPPVSQRKQQPSFFAKLLNAAPAEIQIPLPTPEPAVSPAVHSATPGEYDDILSLLRS